MNRRPAAGGGRPAAGAEPTVVARDAAPVLLVAACTGARCQALRELHGASTAAGDGSGTALRAAVRDRPRAVLLSTACLARCHLSSVAAVGWAAAARSGQLSWLGPPLLLGMLDLPHNAAAAAAWIRHGAPDPRTLPAPLTPASTA